MSLKTAFTDHLFHLVIQPVDGDSSPNKRVAERVSRLDVTSTKTNFRLSASTTEAPTSCETGRFRMNTALKHWKEAATLILAAGHRLGAEGLSSRTPVSAAPPPSLDRSQGRSHQPHEPGFDYDVLMLKRSSKSGFMPNAYVFPGGLIDSSDFSSEWLDIFQQFANTPNFGLRSVKQRLETRPPIFATDRLKLGSPIPGEVAFRICALRETFEESGVLLVVSQPEISRLSKSVEDMSAFHQVLDNRVNKLCMAELSRWRTRVIENPSNFIRMCKELQVLPNIWALHEWSNWLTPVGRHGTSRFDTAFFICCLSEIPQTRQDEKEIVKFQVMNLIHYAHVLSYFSRLNVDLLDYELGQKPPILLTGLDRQSERIPKAQRLPQNKIPPNILCCGCFHSFLLVIKKTCLITLTLSRFSGPHRQRSYKVSRRRTCGLPRLSFMNLAACVVSLFC